MALQIWSLFNRIVYGNEISIPNQNILQNSIHLVYMPNELVWKNHPIHGVVQRMRLKNMCCVRCGIICVNIRQVKLIIWCFRCDNRRKVEMYSIWEIYRFWVCQQWDEIFSWFSGKYLRFFGICHLFVTQNWIWEDLNCMEDCYGYTSVISIAVLPIKFTPLLRRW